MTERTRLTGEHLTDLQIDMAKAEMMTLAREYAKENGCSLIVAMGMIESQLRHKLQAERTLGTKR